MTRPEWLDRASVQAERYDWSLASLFARCLRGADASVDELVAELACDRQTMSLICLCRVPSSDHFAEDVNKIADRFGLKPGLLASIIRRAIALDALRADDASEAMSSQLLAARDKVSGDGEDRR
jgi:hypothetical protein